MFWTDYSKFVFLVTIKIYPALFQNFNFTFYVNECQFHSDLLIAFRIANNICVGKTTINSVYVNISDYVIYLNSLRFVLSTYKFTYVWCF